MRRLFKIGDKISISKDMKGKSSGVVHYYSKTYCRFSGEYSIFNEIDNSFRCGFNDSKLSVDASGVWLSEVNLNIKLRYTDHVNFDLNYDSIYRVEDSKEAYDLVRKLDSRIKDIIGNIHG